MLVTPPLGGNTVAAIFQSLTRWEKEILHETRSKTLYHKGGYQDNFH